MISARSNDISPPPRSETMMRSPSKRWPATDIDRCSEKKISSADAGVRDRKRDESKQILHRLADRLHVGVEHPHAELARIPVGAVGDDSGHV